MRHVVFVSLSLARAALIGSSSLRYPIWSLHFPPLFLLKLASPKSLVEQC
jgi:hypothetical protein